jgi:eukaryotic-like serine/threonine-protein kinase
MLLGTPAYMAPEQVQARPDVDARADIYAFGALLHELLTGHRAWPGDSPLAVAAARLLSPPPDPRARRRDLPAPYAELVMRCMAREPGDRPSSIGEVAASLAAIAHGPSATSVSPTPAAVSATALSLGALGSPTPPRATQAEKTVAVLPFRNAGAPDDDYLAEELTDDLLDALSMTRGLKVRARGAVLRFRGNERDPREIGRELGVQVVVEGSVRRGHGRVRISARLVSVADGFQIWAKRFDRPEQDVLSINDEAARAIAEALTLDGDALHDRAREAPSNPIAIDLYIRARHEYRKFWPDHVRRSVELFEQALVIAPDDPLLLSGLSLSLSRITYFAGDAGIPRARDVAERAVAAAPQLGEAHLAYGSMLFQCGEAPAAMRALRAAVARSPGLAEAHAMIGRLLAEVGTGNEAVRHFEAALALDPDTPLALPELARVHALLGQWDTVDQMFDRVRRTSGVSVWSAARMALWRHRGDLVLAYLADIPDQERKLRIPRMLLESVQAGELSPDARNLEGLAGGSARRQAFMLQFRGELAAFLGEDEEVIVSLRASVDAGLIDRLWLDRCPLFDAARLDPRFAAIHAEVKRRADAVLAAYRSP